MASDKEKNAQDKTVPVTPPVPPKPLSVEESLKNNVLLIDKSVKAKNTRQINGRLLRQTAAIRSKLSAKTLLTFLDTLNTENEETVSYLKGIIQEYQTQAGSGGDITMEDVKTSSEPVQLAAEDVKMDETHVSAPDPTSAPVADMDVDTVAASTSSATTIPSDLATAFPPEVDLYAYLLVMTLLCDRKQFDLLKTVSSRAASLTQSLNRRTMDALASRVWSFLSLAHERTGTLDSIRSLLLAQHRSAQLRHDLLGQETLLCLLLRNFLHYGQYDQAERFRAKAPLQEPFVSSQQYCRYLYYRGRIHAVRLEYGEAKDCLQQAVRRAPSVAGGFLTSATKWLSLVQLLLGDIPERSDFFQPLPAHLANQNGGSGGGAANGGAKSAKGAEGEKKGEKSSEVMRGKEEDAKSKKNTNDNSSSTTNNSNNGKNSNAKSSADQSGKGSNSSSSKTAATAVRPLAPSLKPYFLLTMAVKNGQMQEFSIVENRFAATFAADRTQALVARLRQSVLRAGIRRICMSYSRISLADVAAMLQLPSADDAEYVVAKAIATGAVAAVIDHAKGEVRTSGSADVYLTTEPQEAFHERTVFCLDLHNEAIRAMQFEPDAHKKALQAATPKLRSMDEEEYFYMDDDDLM
uniref:PCI domain-containing protein n=1 Tax=Polytomella parva TaxID=51329 RepID=A0A7S0UV71_9CHLO|mmetsp:Transcript_19116/g.34581  ORF Transcript_19116/g.34581 Transcript_19116/m.34581 type:complete len:634 (+) Transcript_19116:141-2042(+)|eukprot:CAMPEP_0175056386 /NCGR_PEP_ID=MMETSP0052_2-20121109/10640_1 /TAXON_ID=51329 ORGANISM="Polytomella parva, Strain SAG 63-3" /NCGR_SAMPLE_ID=MMETSP0052_2 /ASSEMBLY_ACC=CAM_ASM_000194 /LENGTH=633 /DNA_ID=CAMNT_0016321403 /DNA_START=49 /DNA_END=1950 /DNA_ORIENTATION=+